MHRSYAICGRSLEVFLGDITDLPVDALVNSENSDLRMDLPTGASVSAAIRRLAGEEFASRTAALGPLALGQAVPVPVPPGTLRARWVIHAASVTKRSATDFETSPEAVTRAVRASLAVATGLGLKSVAMPAFGVRAARLPREVASEVMVEAVAEHLSGPTSLERVVLALLEPESFLVFFERAIVRASAAEAPLVLHLERRDDDVLGRFEGDGALAAVSRAGASARDLDLARERLDRVARAAERTLADASRELRAAGGFVWSFLLPEAVRDRLAATSGRSIVLRTDEALASVPWELAWDGQAFLSERFTVSRGLVAEAAARRPAPRPPGNRPLDVLILGPGGDLGGAAREAEGLLDLFFRSGRVRGELLAGDRATRSRVLARLPHVDALHFAGHGRRLGTGELAWPIGGGDALTPRDLAQADAGHLRLVFANACAPLGTDAGAPSERLGLGRAFLLSGVEGFLGSLWEVADEPARVIALAFWEEVLRGVPVGAALRRARATGRALGSVDWAAYVHYGSPLARLGEPGVRDVTRLS